ncbi:unnamed protein product, partial [Aphanomyces euteiches]
ASTPRRSSYSKWQWTRTCVLLKLLVVKKVLNPRKNSETTMDPSDRAPSSICPRRI